MVQMIDEDLDDFSDVMLIVAMLIGTSDDNTIEHAIRIQKIAFLVDKIVAQPELDEEFDFGPDKFGPMSENVEISVDNLIEWGYAKQAGNRNKGAILTDEGLELVEEISKRYPCIYNLCKEMNEDLSGITDMELVKIVYRLYPEDTVNSLIRDNMVNTDKVDSFSIGMNQTGSFEVISDNGDVYMIHVEDGVIAIEGMSVDV